MNLSAWSVVREAVGDFRRVWPQLVLADLLMRALAVTVLVPIVGLLLRVFLTTTATGVVTGVVTGAGIVAFLLHPIGLATLLVVGAVSLALLFAETGQLMVIGFGAIKDRQVTWLAAFRYASAPIGSPWPAGSRTCGPRSRRSDGSWSGWPARPACCPAPPRHRRATMPEPRRIVFPPRLS